MDQKEKDHEAMVRWQERAQEHRSTINNLFLTYSAALLGIEATQLIAKEDAALRLPMAFELAGLLGVFSFVLGSIVVLVRLRDARLTARIARLRYQEESPAAIGPLRDTSDNLGRWTNRLIPWQVISFFLSVTALAAWILATGWGKL